jgi:hypothetical protein
MSGKIQNKIMGETNNAGDEDVIINNTENGDDNQDENQKVEDAGSEDDKGDSDSDENAGDDQQNDDTDKEEAEDDKTSDEKPAPADDEPKTRKRNIDFILERKNRKIEKLQHKEDENDEDDSDIDPDEAEVIDKRIAKVLSPYVEKQREAEDQSLIESFVSKNPDFAPYANKVKTFVKHPSRRDLPIESIFYEVAGPDLLKIGAERAKKATQEARQSQAGGSTGSPESGAKDAWSMSDDEFTAKQEAIRNKPRE